MEDELRICNKNNTEKLLKKVKSEIENLYDEIQNKKMKIVNIVPLKKVKEKIEEKQNLEIEIENLKKKLKNKKNKKEIEKIKLRKKEIEIKIKECRKQEIILEKLKEDSENYYKYSFDLSCECCNKNDLICKNIYDISKIKDFEKKIEISHKLENEKKMLENEIEMYNEICQYEKYFEEKTKNIERINEILLINDENENNKKSNILLEKEINTLEDKLLERKKVKLDINNYISLIKNIEEDIKKHEKLKDKINIYEKNKVQINKYENEIKGLEENILKKDLLENNIINLEKEITTNEIKIKTNNENKKIVTNGKKNIERYRRILKLFTKEKLIENLFSGIISKTEAIINNILKDLTYFTLKFSIEDDEVIIYKIENNKEIEVGGMSTSEHFITNLAFRLAFGRLNRNININFFIIDEGFDSVCEENLPKFRNMFNLIRKQYDWCIVISHLDKIKEHYDSTYFIEKNDKNESMIRIV